MSNLRPAGVRNTRRENQPGTGVTAPAANGSLIVNEAREAVALLFAGGDQGGSNGQGLTYANPLRAVLAALGLELALA